MKLPYVFFIAAIAFVCGALVADVLPSLNRDMRTGEYEAVQDEGEIKTEALQETPEQLLREATNAIADNDIALAQRATDKLLNLYPKRIINTDIERFPSIKNQLLSSWSNTNAIFTFPLNSETVNLGEQFKGTDFEVAYEHLEKIKFHIPSRREIETKEEFDARYEADLSKSLMIGPFSLENDTFAFPVSRKIYRSGKSLAYVHSSLGYDPSTQSFRWGKYNGDTGRFDLEKDFEWSSYGSVERILISETEDVETYTGRNAFGTTAAVERISDTLDYLLINNLEQFEWSKISFPAPKDGAEKLMGQIGVMYVVKIVKPFTHSEYSASKATVSFPKERRVTRRFICSSLREYWIYNSDTGEVLAHLKASLPQEKVAFISDRCAAE